MSDPSRRPFDPIRRVRGPLLLTRIGMGAETLTRAFWPLWAVLLLVLAAILLQLPSLLPLELFWAATLASGAGLLWGLWRGVRLFHWPTAADAEQRLDATIEGRPLSALSDTQVIGAGDPASELVWKAHIRRMTLRLSEARPVQPDLRLARFDRYGLRYVALTLFVVAAVFGSFWRLDTAMPLPVSGAVPVAAGPSWEGWIEPPAYTGQPSLYLADIPPGPLIVPAGSRVDLRLYGEVGALTVAETVSSRTGEVDSAAEPVHSFEITQPGTLEIMGPNGAVWNIELAPDTPPQIAPEGEVQRDASGEMTQTFSAQDDFGVVGARATIRLDVPSVQRRYGLAADPDPRDPIEVDLPLPITGVRTAFVEALVEDFSKHPFANLPVTILFEAEDAAGQIGQSEPLSLGALPGRRFFDPLAKSIIEQRRDLLWARANGPRVAQLLRAVSYRPEGVFTVESDYLRTRFIVRQLEAFGAQGPDEEGRAEIAEAMWELALRIEEGDLSDAMARLRRAQERLSEAMKDGATDEEIAELMQELREAMADVMRQMAEQMQNQDMPQQDLADMQELSRQDLEDLLQQLQELMEQGRMDEAQALLDQLAQMMQNMQMAQGGQQGQSSPGQQALQGLQETLRDQQGLSDESFQGMQGQQGQGQQGQGQQGQGQQGQGQQGQSQQGQGQGQPGQGQQSGQSLSDQLADRQRALRNELQRQRDGLPGTGAGSDEARESLGEAGRAMDNAEDALRNDDLAGAMDSQAEAMDRLRDGIQSLGEELAENQQQGQGQQGQSAGAGGQNGRRDPLGRDQGGEGRLGTRDNILQNEDVYRRAQDLLEELRRRSGEQARPEEELDYLRRLLDRF